MSMFGGQSNTTAPSFLFGSTQNNSGFGSNSNSAAPMFGNAQKRPTAGLFGSSTPAATNTAAGGQPSTTGFGTTSGSLFGLKPAATTGFGAQASSSAPSTPFGAKPTPAPLTGGLFGATGNNTTTGGLFGQSNAAQSNNTGGLFGLSSTAQNSTSGLFGKPTSTQPSTQSNGLSGGLFGAKTANNAATSTAPASGGLFGLKPTAPTLSGLFNNNLTTSGGLFGNSAPKTGGLFNNQTNSTGGLFGGTGAATANNGTSGLFGSQQQQQQQLQPQLSAMTRVGDLPPDMKKQLQDFDKYISTQHLIATTLNDDLSKHDHLIKSIPSDVSYLHTKILSIKQALKFDIDQLQSLKVVNDELTEDIGNVMQLIIQLSTPGTKLSSSYHLNEFFIKRIKKYRELLETYESVIAEGSEAIAGLERSYNDSFGGIADVVEVVKNQYSLFMELCETLAEIHGEVTRLTQ